MDGYCVVYKHHHVKYSTQLSITQYNTVQHNTKQIVDDEPAETWAINPATIAIIALPVCTSYHNIK